MITAEQARALVGNKRKLRQAEKAIVEAAKQGDTICELAGDYSIICDILKSRGFAIDCNELFILISW